MLHLFSPEGEAALAATMAQTPLLAFDFDGTLAPIVVRPDTACVPLPVARRLQLLSARLPLAIISGRSVADVRARLPFAPTYVVGNHGAEDPVAAAPPCDAGVLDDLRARLRAHAEELDTLGVAFEDKKFSITLHYRLAPDRRHALARITELVEGLGPELRVFGGKLVVNFVPSRAPDKADAMTRLVDRCGAPCATFVGDDVNDEPVFASARMNWLTVRVGRDAPTSLARFWLDSPGEVAVMLDRMLALIPRA